MVVAITNVRIYFHFVFCNCGMESFVHRSIFKGRQQCIAVEILWILPPFLPTRVSLLLLKINLYLNKIALWMKNYASTFFQNIYQAFWQFNLAKDGKDKSSKMDRKEPRPFLLLITSRLSCPLQFTNWLYDPLWLKIPWVVTMKTCCETWQCFTEIDEEMSSL